MTFGNHEFDYRSSGLSDAYFSGENKEEDASLTLPMLLSANIDWEKNKDQEDQKIARGNGTIWSQTVYDS